MNKNKEKKCGTCNVAIIKKLKAENRELQTKIKKLKQENEELEQELEAERKSYELLSAEDDFFLEY